MHCKWLLVRLLCPSQERSLPVILGASWISCPNSSWRRKLRSENFFNKPQSINLDIKFKDMGKTLKKYGKPWNRYGLWQTGLMILGRWLSHPKQTKQNTKTHQDEGMQWEMETDFRDQNLWDAKMRPMSSSDQNCHFLAVKLLASHLTFNESSVLISKNENNCFLAHLTSSCRDQMRSGMQVLCKLF